MKTTLEILGFIWLLPATLIVWTFYVFPLWAIKEIKYEGKAARFIWVFRNPISSSKYDKYWRKWVGWSGPCVYIYRAHTKDMFKQEPSLQDLREYDEMTKSHEVRHCQQQFVFGVFHYPLYVLNVAYIVFSNKWKSPRDKKHAHLDNKFEVDARKAAGQTVDISQSSWPDGPEDYNPWF